MVMYILRIMKSQRFIVILLNMCVVLLNAISVENILHILMRQIMFITHGITWVNTTVDMHGNAVYVVISKFMITDIL